MSFVLDALRARYLAAMGIPLAASAACGGASTRRVPPPANEPTTEAQSPRIASSAPVAPVEPAPAPAPRTACGADEIRESLCDYTPGTECARDSSGITSGIASLAPYGAKGPFPFDAAMTAEWMTPYNGRARVPAATGSRLCCYSGCTPLVVAAKASMPSPPDDTPLAPMACIPKPEAPSNFPSKADDRCPAAVVLPGHPAGKTTAFIQVVGRDTPYYPPSWDVEQCCYRSFVVRTMTGRALRVDGEARVAPARRGSEWSSQTMPPPMRVGEARAAELAREWSEIAALEHASVAAFARISLVLLAHGAPADLVERTHAAALDEIAHARIAYHFASAYGGAPVAPAPLDAGGSLTMSLEELAVETLLDGCIEETVGAEWARREAERADDPVVARALRLIAEDEARHAELAWRIVAWALSADGRIAASLVDALASRTKPASLAELRDDVMMHVVEPCLDALLASSAGPRVTSPTSPRC